MNDNNDSFINFPKNKNFLLAPPHIAAIFGNLSYRIFKNRAQNIECSFGCVTRSAALSTPNVVNILVLNFFEQKFVQHGPLTIAIDCNGLSLLIFEEKWPNYVSGPKIRSKQLFVLDALAFKCMRVGFLCPKCDNFACLHTR